MNFCSKAVYSHPISSKNTSNTSASMKWMQFACAQHLTNLLCILTARKNKILKARWNERPRSILGLSHNCMSLFISSFFLAIAFCAPPGVVTAETVRRGAARGFLPALFVQFGSLIGDTTWAIIALTGLAFLVQNNIARTILSLIGIVLMLKLAW